MEKRKQNIFIFFVLFHKSYHFNYNQMWLKIDHLNCFSTFFSHFCHLVTPLTSPLGFPHCRLCRAATMAATAAMGTWSSWLFSIPRLFSSIQLDYKNLLAFNTKNRPQLELLKLCFCCFFEKPSLLNASLFVPILDQPCFLIVLTVALWCQDRGWSGGDVDSTDAVDVGDKGLYMLQNCCMSIVHTSSYFHTLPSRFERWQSVTEAFYASEKCQKPPKTGPGWFQL